jgi:hypothetical protein
LKKRTYFSIPSSKGQIIKKYFYTISVYGITIDDNCENQIRMSTSFHLKLLFFSKSKRKSLDQPLVFYKLHLLPQFLGLYTSQCSKKQVPTTPKYTFRFTDSIGWVFLHFAVYRQMITKIKNKTTVDFLYNDPLYNNKFSLRQYIIVVHAETWNQVCIEINSYHTILPETIVPCDIVTEKIDCNTKLFTVWPIFS